MASPVNTTGNIAESLVRAAASFPFRRAVVAAVGPGRSERTAYSHLTFAQLDELCDRYASGLSANGLRKGMKILVLLRPGIDFIALVFAVFKTGAIPVLIDPGMGRGNFLRCVAETRPDALVAIPKAHWLKLLFRKPFASIRLSFGFKGSPPGTISLEKLAAARGVPFAPAAVDLDETAAILFTTGSTGPAKGVVYTHRIFISQLVLIKEVYGAGPDEIDMPTFPFFALFSAAMGMTCVIPRMDPTRPALVDPEMIIRTVNDHGVTFSFGSPALWRRVTSYCISRGIRLRSLKKVLMAGAPVPEELHKAVKAVIAEDGETLVPYGATESLPIASLTGSEMRAETASGTREGKGYCVGYPLRGMDIRIIRRTSDPIVAWDDSLVVPPGEVGEIAVKGAVVTPAYHSNPEATRLAKIAERDEVWHRMGDLGYLDGKGRVWFCGRKAHMVETAEGPRYSVCCEAIFNQHPKVARSALVGVGSDKVKKPVIIVEPKPGMLPTTDAGRTAFEQELALLAQQSPFTANIQTFLFHPSFPVDIRHNAKIFREKLTDWATNRIGSR